MTTDSQSESLMKMCSSPITILQRTAACWSTIKSGKKSFEFDCRVNEESHNYRTLCSSPQSTENSRIMANKLSNAIRKIQFTIDIDDDDNDNDDKQHHRCCVSAYGGSCKLRRAYAIRHAVYDATLLLYYILREYLFQIFQTRTTLFRLYSPAHPHHPLSLFVSAQ